MIKKVDKWISTFNSAERESAVKKKEFWKNYLKNIKIDK